MEVSLIDCYGNRLKSGPMIKQFPWKPWFYTKVSMATTAAPLDAILKHAKENPNFNSVVTSTMCAWCHYQ